MHKVYISTFRYRYVLVSSKLGNRAVHLFLHAAKAHLALLVEVVEPNSS